MPERHDDIERYRNNQMTDAERHAFEKRALADPFLSDAVDGAELVDSKTFGRDVATLKQRLEPSRPSRRVFAFRIAAGLALLLTAGWLIWNIQAPVPEQMASGPSDSTILPSDTTRPMLSLATQEEPGKKESGTQAKDKETAALRSTEPSAGPQATTRSAPAEVAREEEPPRASAGDLKVAQEQVTSPVPESTTPGLQEAEKSVASGSSVSAQLSDDANRPSEVIAFAPGSSPPSRDTSGESKRAKASGDELARPSTGIDAYRQYLEKNKRIPEPARQSGVHGKVKVSFTVDATGAIKDLAVVESLGFGCDEELIRLIQQGPAWLSSRQHGQPVASTVWVILAF